MKKSVPSIALVWFQRALRFFLGGILLYASLTKWGVVFQSSAPFVGLDPHGGPIEFAKKIAQYDLLPTALIPGFALAILGLELVLGICLLIGCWLRAALWLCVPLFVAFGGAVAYAILTHKQIDCGCFGNQPVPATWGNLARDDLIPLGVVGVLLWLQYRKPSASPA